MTRQRTRKPTHPGIVFKTDVLDALDLSISKAADIIGISRKHLSAFVNGNVPCSKELATQNNNSQQIAGRLRIKVLAWCCNLFILAFCDYCYLL